MDLFKKLNDEGTTIVQVTHSEAHAARGNRIITLGDGWLTKSGAAADGNAGDGRKL
jgi:predicted ABC-type transport system involved in lysophospholipase L1 biosynthesis ATPase subunit